MSYHLNKGLNLVWTHGAHVPVYLQQYEQYKSDMQNNYVFYDLTKFLVNIVTHEHWFCCIYYSNGWRVVLAPY